MRTDMRLAKKKKEAEKDKSSGSLGNWRELVFQDKNRPDGAHCDWAWLCPPSSPFRPAVPSSFTLSLVGSAGRWSGAQPNGGWAFSSRKSREITVQDSRVKTQESGLVLVQRHPCRVSYSIRIVFSPKSSMINSKARPRMPRQYPFPVLLSCLFVSCARSGPVLLPGSD